MTGNDQHSHHWTKGINPLPTKWAGTGHRTGDKPLNFSSELKKIVTDVVARVPLFAHIDPAAILYTITSSRTRSKHGLLARITPLRFANGKLSKQVRGKLYQAQRYVVDGREKLYIFTCCLPRFLDQCFEEKWITIFHELYHIGPKFDGDLRRHDGRYQYHTRRQKAYDADMGQHVRKYLAEHPEPSRFAFLHYTFDQLWAKHGGIYGVNIPRPRMIAVSTPPEEPV
jgi:Putative phage metallopeptidase